MGIDSLRIDRVIFRQARIEQKVEGPGFGDHPNIPNYETIQYAFNRELSTRFRNPERIATALCSHVLEIDILAGPNWTG